MVATLPVRTSVPGIGGYGAAVPLRRTARLSLAAAVLALAAGACSSADPEAQPHATPTTASTSSDAPGELRFEGTVDEFYEVPDPLPPGEPGDLIRTQELEASGDGPRSLRIMYRSVDSTGADRAVTGTVTIPEGEAPVGGWPVLSSAHGTTGIAAPCAPSRWSTEAPSYGLDGVVAVATDYIGLGPVGELHPYLSGIDEGRSVIDAVRAVQALPDVDASTTWVGWGHSQGGHAALWANELAEAYAPELDLRGTAVLAPAAELTKVYGPVDQIVTNIVSVMGLYGAAALHDDVVPADYVGAEAAEVAPIMEEACLDEITEAFLDIEHEGFYDASPIETEPARSHLLDSEPGTVAAASPIILVQGDQDIRVHPQRTADLLDRLCDVGQVTEFVPKPGTDHGSVIGAARDEVATWLRARLDGEAAPDSCVDGEPPSGS